MWREVGKRGGVALKFTTLKGRRFLLLPEKATKISENRRKAKQTENWKLPKKRNKNQNNEGCPCSETEETRKTESTKHKSETVAKGTKKPKLATGNGQVAAELNSVWLFWGTRRNSNHKLGIYLRSVNDYHLKCARLPPKNQLLEKHNRPTPPPPLFREGVKGPKWQHMFFMPELFKWMSDES